MPPLGVVGVTVSDAALSPSSRVPAGSVVCASAVAGRASAPESASSAAAASAWAERTSECRAARWRAKPADWPAGAVFKEGRPPRQGKAASQSGDGMPIVRSLRTVVTGNLMRLGSEYVPPQNAR